MCFIASSYEINSIGAIVKIRMLSIRACDSPHSGDKELIEVFDSSPKKSNKAPHYYQRTDGVARVKGGAPFHMLSMAELICLVSIEDVEIVLMRELDPLSAGKPYYES